MRVSRSRLAWVLPLALSIGIAGCRNSDKTASAKPSPHPKPQATPALAAATPMLPTAPGKPTPWARPPSLDSMVPVKTFEIHPPAAFTEDQLPRDQAVEFLFDGTAGQMLRVRVGQPFRVRVQASGDSSELTWGGDSNGSWFYALPKAGRYRVLYAPWKTTAGIQFDFLADNDPLADPGVKPEQVEVDFGSFASKEDLATVPFSFDDGEDYLESWPTHLAVHHRDFEFHIMTVAGNKAVFKDDERMTGLETAIRAHGKGANVKKLPYSAYLGGGTDLWTQPEYVEGDGWRGLRWIGSFSNGGAWCSPEEPEAEGNLGTLAYYFEGVSNDGHFFILLRSHLSSQELSSRFNKDCLSVPTRGRRYQDVEPDLNTVFQKNARETTAASFQPNLDQLDAVIRSLKLKP